LQRDLSVTCNKVGDMLRAQGQPAEALASYQKALTIVDKLATQDPENARWQRDLSVTCNKVGDVLNDQKQLPEAEKSYQRGLTIRERLAKQDPENVEWQHDLALSYERVGDVTRKLKRWQEAADAFNGTVEIGRAQMSLPNGSVNFIADFSYAVASRWELLRDAPPAALKIDRAAALADLQAARDALLQLQQAGRLITPMDKSLTRIEALLQAAAQKPSPTPPAKPSPNTKKT
jgi:tetratricopeptide (TPR) repeat protein